MGRRLRLVVALALVAAALQMAVGAPSAEAGIGYRDVTYGSGGESHVDLRRGNEHVVTMARRADGSFVLASIVERHAVWPSGAVTVGLAITRLHADGSTDLSYGTGGTTFTPVPVWPLSGVSYHSPWPSSTGRILADGSVVVSMGGYSPSTVVKVRAGGGLDTTYGDGGTAGLHEGSDGGAVAIQGVELLDSGAALLVARDASTFGQPSELIRLDAHGHLDPTLGDGGRRPLGYVMVNGFRPLLAGGPGGSMYVGLAKYGGSTLQRLRPDGTVDPTFALGTWETTGEVLDVAVLDDGRLDLLLDPAGPDSRRVTRLSPFGTPDLLFGSLGTSVPLPSGGSDRLHEMAGGLVIASWGHHPMERLTPLGQLDGDYVPYFTEPWDWGALLPLPDGGYLLAGSQSSGSTDLLDPLAVVRFDGYGVMDVGFGQTGVATLRLADGGPDTAITSGVDLLGRLTMVGDTGEGWAVTRLLPTGAPDPTYGVGGVVNVDLPKVYEPVHPVVLPDGGVAALVTRYDPAGTRYEVFRLDPAGHPLAGWGTNGLLLIELGGARVSTVVGLSAGRLGVGVGALGSDVPDQIRVLRPDGTLDPLVDGDGIVDVPTGVTRIASDGAGFVAIGSRYDVPAHLYLTAMARFTATGAVDTAFGSAGRVDLPSDPKPDAVDLVVAPDRTVHVVTCDRIERVTSTGAVDIAARLTRDVWCDGWRKPLTVDPAGRLLLADDAGIHRYSSRGVVDTTFGDQGLLQISAGTTRTAYASGLRILLAGEDELDLWAMAILALEPPGIPTVSVGSATTTEGDAALVTISLDHAAEAPVEVVFEARDVWGQRSLDVQATRAVVPVGLTSIVAELPTREDELAEDTEVTTLVITEVSNAVKGTGGKITILDDEPAGDTPAAPTALLSVPRWLMWGAPTRPGASHITGWSVVVNDGAKLAAWINAPANPGGGGIALPILVPGRTYQVRVVAWNAHGMGEPSAPVDYTSPPPPTAQQDQPYPANWSYPPAHHAEGLYLQWYSGSGGAPIQGYSIAVTSTDGSQVFAWKNFGPTERDVLLTGMPRDRELVAWIVTWRSTGPLVWSDPVMQLNVADGQGHLWDSPAAKDVELARRGGVPAVVWDFGYPDPYARIPLQAVSVVVTRGSKLVSFRTYPGDTRSAPLVASEISGGAKVSIVTWTVRGPVGSEAIAAAWP